MDRFTVKDIAKYNALKGRDPPTYFGCFSNPNDRKTMYAPLKHFLETVAMRSRQHEVKVVMYQLSIWITRSTKQMQSPMKRSQCNLPHDINPSAPWSQEELDWLESSMNKMITPFSLFGCGMVKILQLSNPKELLSVLLDMLTLKFPNDINLRLMATDVRYRFAS